MPALRTLLPLATLALFGCQGEGPGLGTVRGQVTLDGRPAPHATVAFHPQAGGRSSLGQTDAEGNYELRYLRDLAGAVVGRHTVEITTASESNPTEKIPARYNQATQLEAVVRPGPNSFNFQLKSP